MSKVLFLPFSIASSLLAGLIGKKVFAAIWSVFDNEEPPEPKHHYVSWKKIIPALILEGAIFRAVRGIVDRAARTAYSRATGAWPGEEQPKSA